MHAHVLGCGALSTDYTAHAETNRSFDPTGVQRAPWRMGRAKRMARRIACSIEWPASGRFNATFTDSEKSPAAVFCGSCNVV